MMVGADTADFFTALDDVEAGLAITSGWPATARRLGDEIAVSVGFVAGKRLLGGMLELLMHCHHLAAVDDARRAAEFLPSPACRAGRVGVERARTMSA